MEIKSYKIREEPAKVNDIDGTASKTFNTVAGRVDVFTYVGGLHGEPFTTFECTVGNRQFHAKIQRWYSHRYFRRLANQFADMVLNGN